jgi:hypothetical protein
LLAATVLTQDDLAPEDITKVAAEIRQLTDKPFGINLWFSTFDQGGDTLEQAAYERIMALFALRRARIASCLPTITPDFQRCVFIQ